MKIAALLSGGLGASILGKLKQEQNLVAVLTDSKSAEIISSCEKFGIPLFKGNPRGGKGSNFLKKIQPDVIISVNYLFLIEPDLINLASQLAFNIHGSLLPKYRGRTPHVWSIINGEEETGITAHVIDAGCDTGGILAQKRVEINSNDTGASLLEKYSPLYKELIDEVLAQIMKKGVNPIPQNEKLATYFSKRVPEDGQINWNWQAIRIRNWVRAQSIPYPGAFSFLKGQRLVIDWVEPSDFGFKDDIPNGTILSIDPFLVKCPNSAIEIKRLRTQATSLVVGNILD